MLTTRREPSHEIELWKTTSACGLKRSEFCLCLYVSLDICAGLDIQCLICIRSLWIHVPISLRGGFLTLCKPVCSSFPAEHDKHHYSVALSQHGINTNMGTRLALLHMHTNTLLCSKLKCVRAVCVSVCMFA